MCIHLHWYELIKCMNFVGAIVLIGLNLPAKDKMVEPAFAMHWSETIPKVVSSDKKSEVHKLYCPTELISAIHGTHDVLNIFLVLVV